MSHSHAHPGTAERKPVSANPKALYETNEKDKKKRSIFSKLAGFVYLPLYLFGAAHAGNAYLGILEILIALAGAAAVVGVAPHLFPFIGIIFAVACGIETLTLHVLRSQNSVHDEAARLDRMVGLSIKSWPKKIWAALMTLRPSPPITLAKLIFDIRRLAFGFKPGKDDEAHYAGLRETSYFTAIINDIVGLFGPVGAFFENWMGLSALLLVFGLGGNVLGLSAPAIAICVVGALAGALINRTLQVNAVRDMMKRGLKGVIHGIHDIWSKYMRNHDDAIPLVKPSVAVMAKSKPTLVNERDYITLSAEAGENQAQYIILRNREGEVLMENDKLLKITVDQWKKLNNSNNAPKYKGRAILVDVNGQVIYAHLEDANDAHGEESHIPYYVDELEPLRYEDGLPLVNEEGTAPILNHEDQLMLQPLPKAPHRDKSGHWMVEQHTLPRQLSQARRVPSSSAFRSFKDQYFEARDYNPDVSYPKDVFVEDTKKNILFLHPETGLPLLTKGEGYFERNRKPLQYKIDRDGNCAFELPDGTTLTVKKGELKAAAVISRYRLETELMRKKFFRRWMPALFGQFILILAAIVIFGAAFLGIYSFFGAMATPGVLIFGAVLGTVYAIQNLCFDGQEALELTEVLGNSLDQWWERMSIAKSEHGLLSWKFFHALIGSPAWTDIFPDWLLKICQAICNHPKDARIAARSWLDVFLTPFVTLLGPVSHFGEGFRESIPFFVIMFFGLTAVGVITPPPFLMVFAALAGVMMYFENRALEARAASKVIDRVGHQLEAWLGDFMRGTGAERWTMFKSLFGFGERQGIENLKYDYTPPAEPLPADEEKTKDPIAAVDRTFAPNSTPALELNKDKFNTPNIYGAPVSTAPVNEMAPS